jgi:PKD repeat protein/ribosomal protein L40E
VDSWPTYTTSITVYAIPLLTASATGNPNSGTVPLTVNFQSTVNGGIYPYTYSWVFGDGNTSYSANPSNTYSSAGVYNAQVTVTDSASSTNRQTVSSSVPVNALTPAQTFNLSITFTKPDGSPLTSTTIYYGMSQGQETSVFGTTDSSGAITSTNSALASQTLYFKSSDGRYTGNTYVGSTGGTASVWTTESSGAGSPMLILALLVVVCGIAGAGVIVWKKVLSKPKSAGHKLEEKASHAHSQSAHLSCPHCKAKLPADAEFCHECGRKIKG